MNFGDVPMNAAGLPRLHAMRTIRHSGWGWSSDGRPWKSRLMNGPGERSRSPGDILNCLRQATSTDTHAWASAKVWLRPHERAVRAQTLFGRPKPCLHGNDRILPAKPTATYPSLSAGRAGDRLHKESPGERLGRSQERRPCGICDFSKAAFVRMRSRRR
jgi:hypothetical protein